MATHPEHRQIEISPIVRYYASGAVRSAREHYLASEEYAAAREAIPTWCLDGLVCASDGRGRPAVVLVARRGQEPADGPFRGEPWVVGGRWDMVTPWEQFVRGKAIDELFGGRTADMDVTGPIGNQLFATGWGRDADGPFSKQGVTLQYCYQVELKAPIVQQDLRPDRSHSGSVILHRDSDLTALHPYIRDVIEMSGWLA